MSTERDLATAIHHELISPASIKAALDQWQASSELQRNDHARMWSVIAGASCRAIEAVLARRQREAARTGPWDTP
jgi:predicted RNA-binding protein associated with RNAse of E/G family